MREKGQRDKPDKQSTDQPLTGFFLPRSSASSTSYQMRPWRPAQEGTEMTSMVILCLSTKEGGVSDAGRCPVLWATADVEKSLDVWVGAAAWEMRWRCSVLGAGLWTMGAMAEPLC